MFPERSGCICHTKEEILAFCEHLISIAVHQQDFESQIVADDCVGRIYIRPYFFCIALRAERIAHSVEEFFICFGGCQVKVKCVVLAGFRQMPGFL